MPLTARELRDSVGLLFRAALAEVEPRAAVRRALVREGERLRIGNEVLDLTAYWRVLVVGAGKAASAMAQGALDVFGSRLACGTITTPHGQREFVPGFETWEAAHPLPDTHGLAGAAAALELARSTGEADLLLCLLSGGASALWPAPPSGVSLTELRQVTRALLRSGAPIRELNTVRKHLSRLAGGQLARVAGAARVLALLVSDVVGSPLDVIASGPVSPDPTTYAEALDVLRRRGIAVPPGVLRHLQAGAAGELPETPKPGDSWFARVSTQVVAGNRDALEAAAREAGRLGAEACILSDAVEGAARDVGVEIAREIRRRAAEPRVRPLVLLWGGETTVEVRGTGKGGRNQELALAAALELDGMPGFLLGALGTDGTDGPTDAAGAVVDGDTIARARAAGFDAEEHLARNDAYPLLRAAGDLLVTGATGTNVNDLVIGILSEDA